MTGAKKEGAHHARQIASVGEPMLTISDLCIRYKCHRVTIWKRVRRGELPAPQMPGPNSPRWTPESIRDCEASMPMATYAPAPETATA